VKAETVIIVLPIPPKVLSTNTAIWSQRGRFAKASATRKQRRLAKEAIMEERIETAPWKKISIRPQFFYKTNRKHDEINAIATLKGAYDGIVDSGLVTDDDYKHWTNLTPAFFVDSQNPRVLLLIERLA